MDNLDGEHGLALGLRFWDNHPENPAGSAPALSTGSRHRGLREAVQYAVRHSKQDVMVALEIAG